MMLAAAGVEHLSVIVKIFKKIQFCEIYGYKKGKTTNFSPSSFLLLFDPGSGIQDPGWQKNKDPG
jgi:hypothetical protein